MENAPVHLCYALLPAREEQDPRYAPIVKSILGFVGQDDLLSKLAAVIAEMPTLYGGELENSIEVFDRFTLVAGPHSLFRLPLPRALQQAYMRYRLNVGRPGYGFGGDDESDEYRKAHLLLSGVHLLQ